MRNLQPVPAGRPQPFPVADHKPIAADLTARMPNRDGVLPIGWKGDPLRLALPEVRAAERLIVEGLSSAGWQCDLDACRGYPALLPHAEAARRQSPVRPAPARPANSSWPAIWGI